jgi:hypothetical protein
MMKAAKPLMTDAPIFRLRELTEPIDPSTNQDIDRADCGA